MRLGGAIAAIAISVTLLPACDTASNPGGAGVETTSSPSAAAAVDVTVSVDDDVVAATSPVAFTQGKVVAIEGDQVTFAYGRADASSGKKPQRTVSAIDVYRLGTPSSMAEGAFGICGVVKRKTSMLPLPTWHPCKVLKVRSGKLRVMDHYGTEFDLDADRVIAPRDATQKAIETYVTTELAHRKFDHAFEAAGIPERPPRWEPTADTPVVVHWVGSSWYGGKVVEVKKDKGKVRVDFEGDRWSDRDVAWSEVGPLPATPPTVSVDQFVLVRPAAADERWEHHQVVSVADDAAEVINRNGEKRNVKRGDLIAIVKRAPRAP